MLKLCWKDFIAGRWFWLLILIICVLYGAFPIFQISAVIAVGLGLVVGMLLVTLFIEDRYRTETLYCSLPLKRSTIVRARYLLSGFMVVASAIFLLSYGFLVNSVLKMKLRQINLDALLTLEGILGFVFMAGLLISVFFPLFFRFGLAKGTVIFMIILIVVTISASAFYSGKIFLNDPGARILRIFSNIKGSLTPPLFLLLTLALGTGIVFLSVRISIRSYNQRDF